MTDANQVLEEEDNTNELCDVDEDVLKAEGADDLALFRTDVLGDVIRPHT